MDLEELLHVYDSHTGNGLRRIEGEESDYSREELLEIIKDGREEMKNFEDNWLKPAIEELERFRSSSHT